MIPKNDKIAYSIFEYSVHGLSANNYLPVRLSACKSLVRYAKKVEIQELNNFQ